ncbi:hypothetical protein KL905_001786 [Ogataea polymorpha]|nr:hypothetical protein KL905_001786 [Ogataea polymorpha]
MSSNSQYKYDEMSNKVLRANRRLMDDRGEASVLTTPQSVIGKISIEEMGSRVERETKEAPLRVAKKKKKINRSMRTLLDTSIEELTYVPTSEKSQQIYEDLLAWCSEQLDSDVPGDIVQSMADIILEILKNERLTDLQRKSTIEETMGKRLDDEDFQKVLDLSKEIDDWKRPDGDGEGGIIIDEEDEDAAENEEEDEEDDEDEEDEEEPFEAQEIDDDVLLLTADGSADTEEFDIKSIDKYWLTRLLAQEFKDLDSYRHTELSQSINELLTKFAEEELDKRKLESSLLQLFDYESNDTVRKITKHPLEIYFAIKLSQASEAEKSQIFDTMISRGLEFWVNQYKGIRKHTDEETGTKRQKLTDTQKKDVQKQVPRYIDIESLIFEQGSHLMTNTKFQLPQGSFKRARKSWEEIHIPPPKKPEFQADEKLIDITELPEWAQTAFPSNETTTLNRIQSKVYPAAFHDDTNILMCAPTGAGKTNVAMLAVLRTISKFMSDDETIRLNDFKIVYIAPLKALVQEQVREFQRRLSQFNITVNELTGDSNLTKHQIATTQILVTTPEKWDVITRKMNDASYVRLVRLIILDEVHLLHDIRGPVLESIVARTLKYTDDNNEEPVRLVGLSATLPNYVDVARFLRVEEKGLFYFDATYRPCPLAQQFVGITEKKSLKRFQAMNEVCYDKVVENLSNGHQVIIFVHSRKETEKTAKWIVDKLIETERVTDLIKFTPGVQEILRTEAQEAANEGLKNVLPMGFGIHHAGMNKKDRSTTEDLFAQGYLKVLVSTATLAWGVNLPAHTVIIKGTNVYSPEKGTWVELSPQDILQMLGRAGRPRYDTHGEGIIITNQDEVKYYLAILNQQLPIESQLISKLVDNLNAEIVLGTIQSLEDCIKWLGYTYLYVRMSHSRSLYHVGMEYDNDTDLVERRRDLAYSALLLLAKNGLIKYSFEKDQITTTNMGPIASHYYISYRSIRNYSKHLNPDMNESDLFRMFASSEEFKYIPVRQEEKMEIKKLMERAPIPVSESNEDPLAKISILLQAYISQLRLEGFALMADMIYVVQSAGRLFRAMLEMALKKGWPRLAVLLMDLCKIIERRLWLTNSPFRQFPKAPFEIIQTTERSMTPWKYYLRLSDEFEVAQALKSERFGRIGFELLQKFPRLTMSCQAQPITPSLLKVEAEIIPSWKWDYDIHGWSEQFILLVEDCDSEKLLYYTTLIVQSKYIDQPHLIDFTVPFIDSSQPNYFVSLISDRWLHCESKVPIMLSNLKMPKKFPAPTPLLDFDLIETSEVGEFSKVFNFKTFNRVQSQVFDTVFNTSESTLCFCSKGCGKTTIAELALLSHWNEEKGRAVYLTTDQYQIDQLSKRWKKVLGPLFGGKEINKLTGELSADLKLLGGSHLILATPEQFDLISRRWQQRKNIQSIELVIADDCHAIGFDPVYELVLSRVRFIAINLKKEIRIVALGSSLANSGDVADWLGVPKQCNFNFDSKERENSLEVKFQAYQLTHHSSMVLAMIRPAYNAIRNLDEERCVLFVPTRSHCVDVAKELIRLMTKDDANWLRTDLESIEKYLDRVHDSSLKEVLKYGIGFYYTGMTNSDRVLVEKLYSAGALTCLMATKDTCYWSPAAEFVIIMTTQTYEGKEHRYIDYPINDILEMVGLSRNPNATSKALILTNEEKIGYYKKFLGESLPIESQLAYHIHDAFVNDISTQLIRNRQDCVDWITYSYFYRRLQGNPSYYGLRDTSEDGISEYLSELVENTLNDLVEAKIIELDIDEDVEQEEEEELGDEIKPLNGCMISAYYNVSFVTMQTFSLSLNNKTNLRGLLEVVASAHEFDDLPIRNHEDEFLAKLYNRLPLRSASIKNFESPSFKCFILIQAHLSRINLPPDLTADLKNILLKVVNLLYAAVDVLSSEGFLNAMTAMDLTQMVVQAMWANDNPLKQIPYFSEDILKECEAKKIETVYDIMALEDDDRDELLRTLNEKQLGSVADFVNKYPNLELSYELHLDEPIRANQPKEIVVNIERDEEVEELDAVCPRFPCKKMENWWIVVGEHKRKELYAIKKLAISSKSQQVRLSFTIPDAGEHKLGIWCVCDSYIDTDKQIELDVKVL